MLAPEEILAEQQKLISFSEDEECSDEGKKKLQIEVKSWRSFATALRLEDRQLLNTMLEKIWPFTDMIEECKEGYETEAFLLGLLVIQQKTIDRLEEMIAEKKRKAGT